MQHNPGLGLELAPQHVPSPGRGDAEGAGHVSGEEHVGKSYPDYMTENHRRPVIGNKGAIFHDIADRHLHPAIVDHDPEGGKGRSQSHHRRRQR